MLKLMEYIIIYTLDECPLYKHYLNNFWIKFVQDSKKNETGYCLYQSKIKKLLCISVQIHQ